MIEIIENNLKEPIICVCKRCGSKFKFDYKDIQRREDAPFSIFAGRSWQFVICPVCKDDVLVTDETINGIKNDTSMIINVPLAKKEDKDEGET